MRSKLPAIVVAIALVAVAVPVLAADAPRVGDVETWAQAPEALARSYRTARLVQSSLSLTTGTAAAVGGVLELTGAADLYEADNAVFGALLLTGGLSSMTVGVIGILRPVTDGEIRAGLLVGSEDDDEIRSWLLQRQIVARRARIVRAVGFAATSAGLLLSAVLVQDADAASDVAGFETIAGTGADVKTARRTLAVLGGVSAGLALFVGLRPGPEDRVLRQIEEGGAARRGDAALSVGLVGTGARLRVLW